MNITPWFLFKCILAVMAAYYLIPVIILGVIGLGAVALAVISNK